MESTGIKGKIQASETTYELLVEGRKEYWVTPRPDAVIAKGKGVLKTYMVNPTARRGSSVSGSSVSGESVEGALSRATDSTATTSPMSLENVVNVRTPAVCLKEQRLVNWITDLFIEPVKKLIARRPARPARFGTVAYKPAMEYETYLDEVAEAIILPRFSAKSFSKTSDFRKVQIDEEVVTQLRDYVGTIAASYNANPFHNCKYIHLPTQTQRFVFI